MFGKIELAQFEPLTKAPQDAASAMCVFEGEIVGAGYKPILYLGKQVAKGTDYFFIAEQVYHKPIHFGNHKPTTTVCKL